MLDRLGVAEQPLAVADPVSFLRSLAAAGLALFKNPVGAAAANTRLAIGLAAALRATAERTMGSDAPGPVSPAAGDKRFLDAAYADNPLYFLLEQQYLLNSQLVLRAAGRGRVARVIRTSRRGSRRSSSSTRSRPPTSLPGNPAALRAAFDTGGKSVVRGARNMLGDIRHNGGWPSQVDGSGFEVGVNMAATPGAVVYRSDLIELIQYEPQTTRVHAVPLLFCPPWINKYYIMDLAPGKSLIEWAVQHGHTVLRDQLPQPRRVDARPRLRGLPAPGPAATPCDVVREITGAAQVNTLSVCLGGTLTAIGLAHNAAHRRPLDQRQPRSSTRLARLQRSRARSGAFTDEATIAGLEKQMAEARLPRVRPDGATRSTCCGRTTWCSSTSSTTGCMGEKPPAFDLLAWNDDSTRMPAEMHSQYLRSCYLSNEFASGEFEIDGDTLDPAQGRRRHLRARLRWTTTSCRGCSGYRTTQLLGGAQPVRAEHVGPHRRHRQSAEPQGQALDQRRTLPADPQEWKARPRELQDERTWWEDWADVDRRSRAVEGARRRPTRQRAAPADRGCSRQLRYVLARDTDPTTDVQLDSGSRRRLPAAHPRGG